MNSVDNALLQNLQCLSSANVNERQNAEAFMKMMEKQKNFSVALLHILEDQNIDCGLKHPAVIVLNNFIRNSWNVNYPEPAIVNDEKWHIKEKLPQLSVMLNKNIALFIRDIINNIIKYDTLDNFPMLSAVLSKCGLLNDFHGNLMILELAHSICKKYRILIKSEGLWLEIRFLLDCMAANINNLAEGTFNSLPRVVPTNGGAVDFELIKILCKIWERLLDLYHDLIFQELPQEFVDKLELWMQLFYKILTDSVFDLSVITDASLKNQILTSVIRMKLKAIRIINLFISKYENDIKNYIKNFIPIVFKNVSNSGMNNEKFSASCIEFFSRIASTMDFKTLLSSQEDIEGLCLYVIKPNIVLSEHDYEAFESSPSDYISKELDRRNDGSNRKAIMDLITNLMIYSENILVIMFLNEIQNMIALSTNGSGNQFNVRDVGTLNAAIFLLSAILVKKRHPLKGVLQINTLVRLSEYFEGLIYPILLSHDRIPAIIVSDALKFLYTFYKFMNSEFLIRVLPIIVNLFSSNNEVYFAYLCLLFADIYSGARLTGQSPYIAVIEHNLDVVLQILIQKVTLNEYCCQLLIKMLLYYNVALKLETVKGCFQQLVYSISNIQSSTNPGTIRMLFECVSVSMWIITTVDQAYFSSVEVELINILKNKIKEQNPGLVDYYYQIFGLLLKLHSKGNVENHYHHTIIELLNPDFCLKVTGASGLCIVIGDYASSFDEIAFGPDAYQTLVNCFKICISRPQDDRFSYIIPKTFIIRAPLNDLSFLFNQIIMTYAEKFNGRYSKALVKGFVHFVLQLFYISDEGTVQYALNMIHSNFYWTFLAEMLYFELIGDLSDVLYHKLVEMLTYFALYRGIHTLRTNQPNLWGQLLNGFIASLHNNRDILDKGKSKSDDNYEGDSFNRLTYCAVQSMPFSSRTKPTTKFITTDDIKNFDSKRYLYEIVNHAEIKPILANILHASNEKYLK